MLAAEVSGIDVLVSGHTHNRLYEPLHVNGAVVMQSGCHGSFIGRLDLDLDEGRIEAVRHRLICIDETIERDAEMQQVVDKIMEPHRQMLSETVGRTIVPTNSPVSLTELTGRERCVRVSLP